MPRPHFALVIVATVLLAAPFASAQSAAGVAQQHFTRGVDLYESGQHAQALAEFQAAVALQSSPNAHLFIARCQRQLGRLATAAQEYEIALRESAARMASDPRYAATHEAAQAELTTLDASIGRVTVEVHSDPPLATISVGNQELGPATLAAESAVTPGTVDIAVHATGYAPQRRSVTVAAGEHPALSFTLVPETDRGPSANGNPAGPRRSHSALPAVRALGWGTIGLSVVAAGAAVTFGILAVNQHQGFEACDALGTSDCASNVSAGRTWETLTNLSIATAGAALVLGTLTLVLARDTTEPRSVRVAVSPAGVVARATF
jgi:hypothetical protein